MIKEALHQVINGKDLTFDMAKEVMKEMMSGEATQVQMAAYLTAMRMKGETIEEITASATVMREMAAKITPTFPVMDIVGTGGDEVGTFNVSTTSAFVIASAGIPIAKHGNRSVSSKSGAADLLEELGINLDVSHEHSLSTLTKANICFLFAPSHHSSMKNVAPVRKEMGERTIFNILGPLSNPAGATMELLGVYDENLVEPLANVLRNLGVTRGMVVCGNDGLDEVTLTDITHVCEIRHGKIVKYDLDPRDYGFELCQLSDLLGGFPEENAKITKSILSGAEQGPKRDMVVLNSAIAIYLGTDDCTIEESVLKAKDMIDSGKAMAKLEEFRTINQGGIE